MKFFILDYPSHMDGSSPERLGASDMGSTMSIREYSRDPVIVRISPNFPGEESWTEHSSAVLLANELEKLKRKYCGQKFQFIPLAFIPTMMVPGGPTNPMLLISDL